MPYRDGQDSNEPMDVGSALKDQVNAENGKLKVFGWEADVGSHAAAILRPIITWGLTWAQYKGAAVVDRYGTKAAKYVLPQVHAAKVGKGLGFLWLFGIPAADLGLEIKKTVSESYKEINELRDQMQPLLAANNNMDVSFGKALTTNFGVIADARARIYENGKRNVFTTIARGIRIIPSIWGGILQYKLDNINNPERVIQAKVYEKMPVEERNARAAEIKNLRSKRENIIVDPKRVWEARVRQNMSAEERNALAADIKDLRSKQAQAKEASTPVLKKRRRTNEGADQLPGVLGVLSDEKRRKSVLKPDTIKEYHSGIKDLLYIPALTDLGGELVERFIGKKPAKVIAWDKIIELQELFERHKHHPDRGHVISYVQDIFQQRAKDMGKRYELEGRSFNETTEAIADAIASGLHPLALAEILDNKKIVSFDAKDADFGEKDDVKDQLEMLHEKYSKKVSEKEFYRNEPFTKESVLETFKGVPEEEKPFFVSLFPPGILEKAGVKKDEVKKYRKDAEDYFVGELTEMITQLAQEDRKELKHQGVTDKAIKKLEAFEEHARRGGIEENLEEAKEVARSIVGSAKDPQKFWENYLKKRSIEEVAATEKRPKQKRSHRDFAERGADDEIGPEMG